MKRSWYKTILLTALLFIVAALVLVGCGSSSSEQPSAPPSMSTAPTPVSPAPASPVTPATPNGAQPLGDKLTVSQVMTSVATSHFLDKTHLNAKLTCDSCHGKVTADQAVIPPNDQKCLSCHGGSYEANALKTSKDGKRNPHASPHDDLKSCFNCHKSHKPSEYACATCHDWSPPDLLKKYLK